MGQWRGHILEAACPHVLLLRKLSLKRMDEQTRIQQQLISIRGHTGACADPSGFVGGLQDLLQKIWNKEKAGQVCATIMKRGKRHLLSEGSTMCPLPRLTRMNTS